MYVGILKAGYGPIRSGTRAYQANFLPATLKTARSLSSVLAVRGSAVYTSNPGFDYQHKGTITVGDLAHAISVSSAAAYTRQVIAQAYAAAPSGVGPEQDPVYGDDFSRYTPLDKILIAAAIALPLAACIVYATNMPHRALRLA